MKTRNLVSSRRLLVGLVMVDAFWMIGEFFPRGFEGPVIQSAPRAPVEPSMAF